MTAYYNEIDPYAAQWLRNLISAGHIAPGDVDERSIVDVRPDDLKGYTQCHFFAGIGGWSLAARLAGWPDERELWTGSCPCQPFSVAGQGKGQEDERHLWPIFFELIRSRNPAVVMGEQVAAAVGKHWLDGVHFDLEGIDYAVRAAVVPACAVDAPHRRDRLWFVADAAHERLNRGGQSGPEGRAELTDSSRVMGDPDIAGSFSWPDYSGPRHGHTAAADGGESALAYADGIRGASRVSAAPGRQKGHSEVPHHGSNRRPGPWGECDWLAGADGKARRIEPSIRLLADGVPARVGKLRAYGNAIVPQVAAEVIGAYLDAELEAAA